jgi:hypothetical protein
LGEGLNLSAITDTAGAPLLADFARSGNFRPLSDEKLPRSCPVKNTKGASPWAAPLSFRNFVYSSIFINFTQANRQILRLYIRFACTGIEGMEWFCPLDKILGFGSV